VAAVVELVKENYLVLRLPSVSGGIVLAPCRDFNLAQLHVFSLFSVGQRVSVNACEVAPDGSLLFARLSSGLAASARTAFTGTVNSVDELAPGQIVKCKVRQFPCLLFVDTDSSVVYSTKR
jgi:hypothetical protein